MVASSLPEGPLSNQTRDANGIRPVLVYERSSMNASEVVALIFGMFFLTILIGLRMIIVAYKATETKDQSKNETEADITPTVK